MIPIWVNLGAPRFGDLAVAIKVFKQESSWGELPGRLNWLAPCAYSAPGAAAT
jgi:hypothetical protein